MSGTIRISQSMQVTNGNSIWEPIGQRFLTVIQDAIGGPTPGTITISTTAAAVDLSELSTFGWVRMKNLDEIIAIDWGPDKGASTIEIIGTIEAGEVAMFRLKAGSTLMVKAQSGTPLLEVLAWED